MHAHKDEYLAAKKEFEFLVQELITRISSWDSRLPFLEPKQCIFRFNRDTRFSDNKSPYKENFGAFFSYGGKKSDLPGYYLHVSPKEIFVAGGVWMPEAESLLKIRRHIVESGDELQAIIKNKNFKKAFTALSTEQVLKRPPKGFSPDDPNVELLKLKSFTVSKPIELEEIFKPGFGKIVDREFRLMKPFNEYLYQAMV